MNGTKGGSSSSLVTLKHQCESHRSSSAHCALWATIALHHFARQFELEGDEKVWRVAAMVSLSTLLAASLLAEEVRLTGGVMEVAVDERGILVASSGSGIFLFDARSNLQNPSLVAFLPEEGACGVAIRDRMAFVTLYHRGLCIVDITDPKAPKVVGRAELDSPACGVALRGPFAFIANYDKGIAVLDVSKPTEPKLVQRIDVGWAFGVSAAEGLVLAASYEPARLWCIDGVNLKVLGRCDFGARFGPYGVSLMGKNLALVGDTYTTRLVDISNTSKPELIGELPTVNFVAGIPDARQLKRTHKAVPIDERHFVAVGITPAGLRIYDASNPKEPKFVSHLPLEGNCYDVTVKDKVAFVANGSRGVAIVDVSDPQKPRLIGRATLPESKFPKPKQRSLKNLWLRVQGKYIVADDGNPYVLMGTAWLTGNQGQWGNSVMVRQCGTLEHYARHFRRLGMNAIRLAVAGYPSSDEDLLENYIGGGVGGGMVPVVMRYPDPTEYVEHIIVPEVERAKRAGVYVVLDLHAFGDYKWLWGWGMGFWRAVSQRFRDEPYVAIYQLTNEPGFFPEVVRRAAKEGRIDPGAHAGKIRELHASTLRRWYQDLINMFRNMGDRHPVLVHDYGIYWYVTERMWSPIEFRPDPIQQVIWGMHPVFREWKPKEPGQEYVRNLMDKWDIPIFFDEVGTVPGSGPHVAIPEVWWFAFQHWLLNEPRKIGFLLWMANAPDDALMAEWWAPVAKALSSENPPPPSVPAPPFKGITVTAQQAKGGAMVTLKDETGKTVFARSLPPEAKVGDFYIFPLPKALPKGEYRLRLKVYSDGSLAPPQTLHWVDSDGKIHPPDEEFGKWSGQDYFFTDAFVIPMFIHGDGWHEWETEFFAYTEISAIAIKKQARVMWYLPTGDAPNQTRPIAEITIAPKEKSSLR